MGFACLLFVIFALYRSEYAYQFLSQFEFGLWGKILLLLFFVVALSVTRKSLWNGIIKFRPRSHLLEPLSLLTLWFPVIFAIRILDPAYDDWMVNTQLKNLFFAPRVLFSAILLVVLKEELLERGLLQPLGEKIFPPRLLVLVLATGFGFYHLHRSLPWNKNIFTFLGVISGTLFLLVAYLKTRSVLATLILHLTINAISLLQTWLHVNGYTLYEMAFWVGYGMLCFMYSPRGISLIRETLPKTDQKIPAPIYATAVVSGLLIPVGILLL